MTPVPLCIGGKFYACLPPPPPLLHKSACGHAALFPGHTYASNSVTGMPSAVKPLSKPTRIRRSATCHSGLHAISRWPSSFKPCIFASTRLRQRYPLHFRRSARPRYFVAWRASLRAMAPALSGYQFFAFLQGGIPAFPPRSAMAM